MFWKFIFMKTSFLNSTQVRNKRETEKNIDLWLRHVQSFVKLKQVTCR